MYKKTVERRLKMQQLADKMFCQNQELFVTEFFKQYVGQIC